MKKNLFVLFCFVILLSVSAGCNADKVFPSITISGSSSQGSDSRSSNPTPAPSNSPTDKVNPTTQQPSDSPSKVPPTTTPAIYTPGSGSEEDVQRAMKMLPPVSAFGVTAVSDFTQLKDAVEQATSGDIIEINNDIEFTDTINIPSGVDLTFLSATINPVRLTVNADLLRHFTTSGADTTVTFDQVILDGSGIGGGIVAYSRLIINGATLENIYSETGAVESWGSLIQLNGVTFENIRSANPGAAVYCSSSSLVIENSTLHNVGVINDSFDTRGGAIFFSGNSADISNTNFDTCFIEGRGVAGYGGGAFYSDSTNATLTLTDTNFNNCYAYAKEGISYHGGAIQTSTTLSMTGGTFTNCWASGYGGAICNAYMPRDNTWSFDDVVFQETQDPTRQDGSQPTMGTAWDGGAINMQAPGVDYQLSLSIHNTTFKGLNGKYNGDVLSLTNISYIEMDNVTVVDDGIKQPGNYGVILINNYEDHQQVNKISNCHFDNDSGRSTLFYSGYGSLEIQDSSFTNNHSDSTIYLNGYAATVDNPATTVSIKNTQFKNNENYRDGTVYASGSYVDLYIGAGTIFDNNTTSVYGGAVEFDTSGTLTVEDTTFTNNTASYGGAIMTRVETIVRNSQFTDNIADTYGGGIYLNGDSGATLTLEGTTFTGNHAKEGGAIYTTVLSNVTADAQTVFDSNQADQSYLMDNSTDITLHANKILTNQFSRAFADGPVFTYGYNNYDINYTNGTPLVLGTVTFDPQNSLDTFTQTVILSQYAVSPDTPTKEGFTFAGWNTTPDGSGIFWDFPTMPIDNDMTLYAQYAIAEFTVTFDSNGGSAVSIQTVPYGELVQEPTIPIKTGNTFDGWYKESSLTNLWDFATEKVTNDMTLFAKWTPNAITPTPTPIVTPTPSGTPTPTVTPLPSGTPTPTITPIPSGTPAPSGTTDSTANPNNRPTTSGTPTPSTSGTTASGTPVPSTSGTTSSGSLEPSTGGTTSTDTQATDTSTTAPSGSSDTSSSSQGPVTPSDKDDSNNPDLSGGQPKVWSLLSLILMIGSLIIGVVAAIKLFRNRKNEDDKEQPKLFKILTIILGAISLIGFFVLYNLTHVMVLLDIKTILFALLLAGSILALYFSRRKDDDNDDKNDNSTEN